MHPLRRFILSSGASTSRGHISTLSHKSTISKAEVPWLFAWSLAVSTSTAKPGDVLPGEHNPAHKRTHNQKSSSLNTKLHFRVDKVHTLAERCAQRQALQKETHPTTAFVMVQQVLCLPSIHCLVCWFCGLFFFFTSPKPFETVQTIALMAKGNVLKQADTGDTRP